MARFASHPCGLKPESGFSFCKVSYHTHCSVVGDRNGSVYLGIVAL